MYFLWLIAERKKWKFNSKWYIFGFFFNETGNRSSLQQFKVQTYYNKCIIDWFFIVVEMTKKRRIFQFNQVNSVFTWFSLRFSYKIKTKLAPNLLIMLKKMPDRLKLQSSLK